MDHPTTPPPPLTEAEAADAERCLGVRLPAECRAHLVGVSAGAGEGTARLLRTADGWWWSGNEHRRRDLLRLPFPHPDSYTAAEAALDGREPRWEDHPDGPPAAEAWNAWDAEYEEFQDRKTAGAVVLREHGCGYATLLALSGPLAGTVWWDGRASSDLIVPLCAGGAGATRPATFNEWLAHGSWALLPDAARPGSGAVDRRGLGRGVGAAPPQGAVSRG
ncbi:MULTISPECIES: SMI1/KNR4 family protein [Streptomyces]|uniref:SMI1/KNR4 family protein n=1 Tax=Streptomyces TaxID=1883 RepID=UPI0016742F32|nr:MULTISPECIES: SMI1/KNR4 family protein [Streptomyces]MBD3578062.1 SMI1/KNR4 family protein [Streptomyces sp. KD18]GGT02343.1 hypothetical protein GCM10010286_29190 [Streptomyces toxytricini]